MKCAYCEHSKKWHYGSRILDSDNTECLHPMEPDDECACTSFMTKKEFNEIYKEMK
jgi:hypothetical protein